MNSPKPRRKRGVNLTSQGWEKLQQAKRQSEIQDNFGDRYTLEDLSDRTRLDPDTVAKVTNRKVAVDKRTLELFFHAFNLELSTSDYFKPNSNFKEPSSSYTSQDLSEAVDVSSFYGRTAELAQLEQWILPERCRVVALLGMGGIGKTSLSVKLAHQIKDKFEYVIWRSLRHAPPIKDILAQLIQFLSNEQITEIALPKSIDDRISQLIRYLQNRPCLLILDNLEAILQSGEHAGYYRQGYEDYGKLLGRLGEIRHQSCIVITSREKPEELAVLEGETLPVRSLRLTGLLQVEAQEVLKNKGVFGTTDEINKLINAYTGNPLALKIVATSIKELFDGNISEFLSQGTTIFNGIRHLLQQQFNRLSTTEKQILYWLAINREPISIAELQTDFLPPVTKPRLLEALESLSRRCLIEKSRDANFRVFTFTLQQVLIEYVTEHLIEQVCNEVVTQEIKLFNSHALLKAQAKEYVRESQVRLILKLVIDKLIEIFNNKSNIEYQLIQLLAILRRSPYQPGYAAGNVLNLLSQMETDLRSYDFSYLSVWQANLQNVSLANVNFAHADLAKSVFAETLGGVLSVAISQDNKLFATGDANGEIRLWQIEEGKQLTTCKGHTGWIRSVAFSHDSNILVSGCSDHTIRLWDVKTGECLKIWHTSRVRSVAFSPQGTILASGGDDRTIQLWDVSSGECLKTWQKHTSQVRSVAFSPQGTILASGSDDNTVILWNVITRQVWKTLSAHQDGVRAVTFSPDGRILATGGEDKVVRLWDVSSGKCLRSLHGHKDGVWSIQFNPQGNKLASGSHDQTIKIWDVNTGNTLKTLQGHTNWVWSITFTTDGQTLVSGSADQTVKLWDVSSGNCIRTWCGRSNGIWSVAFCPTREKSSLECDRLLASVSDDRVVRLWDISTGQILKSFHGHSNGIWSVAFSPQGKILATGSDDQTVRLWDVSSGQALTTLQGHTGWVWSVAFSHQGNILASGGADHTVKLWDISNGQAIRTLPGHTSVIRSVAFSPDGEILASGSADSTVRLWDVKTGKVLAVLQGHTRPVSSVTFSANNQILASGSDDGTVRYWDINTGKCSKTLQGHTDWIQSVAFSPDGKTLASGSHDRTVKIWDIESDHAIKTLQADTGWILSVAFSPDGETLASSSHDGTINTWNVLTGECLKTLRIERLYEGMNITGATSLTLAQKATLKALGAVEFESLIDKKVIPIRQTTSKKGRSAS